MAKQTAVPGRRRQLLTGLMISLVTIALMLGGLELAGYAWEKRAAQEQYGWTLVASRRLDYELHGPAGQPYYLFKPNISYVWEGSPVAIGAHGFRTEPFEIPKPAGTFRILNLGDSIAFGWEVRQEDTYGKQLEQALNAAAPGRRFEVINAGIPAWNMESERNFLLDAGLGYDPDLVILDFTTVNDIFGRGPGVEEGGGLFQWLRDHTYGWPFLTTQVRFLLSRQSGPEAIPVLNPPKEAKSYYPLNPASPKYDEVWALIAEMAAACQARGIPFLIVMFPTAFQVNSAQHPAVPQQVFAERAAAAGLPLVDLLPPYAAACAAAGPDACEGYENLLFADVWMHPNAFGHKIAAEALLPLIRPNR